MNEKAIEAIKLIGWSCYVGRCVYGYKDNLGFVVHKDRDMIAVRATTPPTTTVRMSGETSAEQMAAKLQGGFLQRLAEKHLF